MQKQFNKYLIILGLFFMFGVFLSIFVFLYVYVSGQYISRDVCFEKKCIQDFIDTFYISYSIFKTFFEFGIGAVTVLGIYFAVKNYFLNSDATKMYNHIEYLKLFDVFLINEVEKLDLISSKSINVFKLYNSINPNSKNGSLNDFKEYELIIWEINNEIYDSNKDIFDFGEYDFKYRNHQERLIKILSKIGVNLSKEKRLEFYIIERQVFCLINIVNKEFLGDCLLIDIEAIKYG